MLVLVVYFLHFNFMTQTMIKEKMEGAIEAIAGGVTHFEMNGRNNAEEYIERARIEMRDFAQLICEEMRKKCCHDCANCCCSGWAAKEILKALE